MRCERCGAEALDGERLCDACRTAALDVKVLPPEEKDQFTGVTLEEENSRERDENRWRTGPRERIYVRHISFGSGKTGFLTKIVLTLAVLFFIMIALPVALFVLAVGTILWLLFRR